MKIKKTPKNFSSEFSVYQILFKRILCGIRQGSGLVVVDVLYGYTDILEYFVKSLSEVTERYRTVMREVLSDQDMAVETSHFLNGEYTDSAEGFGGNGKYFAFRKVSSKLCICCGLKSEEGDVAGCDVAFECSVGYLDGKSTGHNLLILHLTGSKLS